MKSSHPHSFGDAFGEMIAQHKLILLLKSKLYTNRHELQGCVNKQQHEKNINDLIISALGSKQECFNHPANLKALNLLLNLH